MDVITHPPELVSRLEAKTTNVQRLDDAARESFRVATCNDKSWRIFCVVGKSVAADVSHEID
jgi:hypothetical protein